MKKSFLFLALLSAFILAQTSRAAVVANYGDIILGFETTGGNSSGGTQNLLIDLGAYSSIGSFSAVNISSDLSTVFGSGWSTNVSYGAYGTTTAGLHWGQNYLTAPTGQATFGTLAQGNTSAKIDSASLVNFYNLQNTNGVTTSHGIYGSSTATGAWSTFSPNTSPFGVSADHNIETTLGTSLNLFDRSYSPNTITTTPYTILVDTAGNLSVSAVPEPSTYALLLMAALAGMVIYRRQESLKNGVESPRNHEISESFYECSK